jgi:hypothetical protein
MACHLQNKGKKSLKITGPRRPEKSPMLKFLNDFFEKKPEWREYEKRDVCT